MGGGFTIAFLLAVGPCFPSISGCNRFGGLLLVSLLQCVMARCRLQVHYEGRVQGVGFRYTAKRVALEFDVSGTVRNLPDGRVELNAEGDRDELIAFCGAVRDSGLSGFIKKETENWAEAVNEFRGFEIVG